jgi:hypothetical protein
MKSISMPLRIACVCAVVSLTSDVMAAGQDAWHSPELPYPQRTVRIGFWPEGRNETFTPDVVQWMGERCSFLVLRSNENGSDPYFDCENVVARFKERFPRLPVLHYDQVQVKRRGTRVDNMNFAIYAAHDEWMLKTATGKVAGADGKPAVLLADITNPEFRRYISDYTAGNTRRFGSDGVAWDFYFASLERKTRLPKHWKDKDAHWMPAASELLSATRGAMNQSADGEKLILFNGLWFVWPGLLEKQRQLLSSADGVCVEYFARNVDVPDGVENEQADFDQYVLGVLDVMRDHPDKIYLVHARSPRYVYLGYEQDYQIQRYGLASFLLGMTPKALFKYHSHFQADYHPPGRTDGMSYYEDYDIDLGVPVGDRFEVGGIHQRRFTKGLVAVAPMHRGDRVLGLAGKHYYTPEGKRCEGVLNIPQGSAALLLSYKPANPPARAVIDNFEDGKAGMWQSPVRDENVVVEAENGNHYLRVRAAANPLQSYHERRIQPIRSLHQTSDLRFRIRSPDKTGAVLIRVEVDDGSPVEKNDQRGVAKPKETRLPYAVLVVRPDGGTFQFKLLDTDIPYGHVGISRPNLKAPYFLWGESGHRADNQWHEIEINLPKTFRRVAPHLTPWRIAEMRLIGEVDLDDVEIGCRPHGSEM